MVVCELGSVRRVQREAKVVTVVALRVDNAERPALGPLGRVHERPVRLYVVGDVCDPEGVESNPRELAGGFGGVHDLVGPATVRPHGTEERTVPEVGDVWIAERVEREVLIARDERLVVDALRHPCAAVPARVAQESVKGRIRNCGLPSGVEREAIVSL